jgi:hypothetical protein
MLLWRVRTEGTEGTDTAACAIIAEKIGQKSSDAKAASPLQISCLGKEVDLAVYYVP